MNFYLQPLCWWVRNCSTRLKPDSLSSLDTTSTEARQEGGSAQDPSTKTMVSRTFDVKFPYDTQLTFESLIFSAGENGGLKILPPESTPGHLALTSSSVLGRSCAGLDHCAGSYICTAKIIRGILVVMSTL
jgi:hypothetical protein